MLGTLGHCAGSVLGDVNLEQEPSVAEEGHSDLQERGCSCPRTAWGDRKDNSCRFVSVHPSVGRASVWVSGSSVLPEGCSSSTPGCPHHGEHQGTELGVPWTRAELQKKSQNTAGTSEPAPRMASGSPRGLWAGEGLRAVPRPENTSEREQTERLCPWLRCSGALGCEGS